MSARSFIIPGMVLGTEGLLLLAMFTDKAAKAVVCAAFLLAAMLATGLLL